jgi:hypothetical protein
MESGEGPQATVEFALKRPEFADKFREYLKSLL